MDIFLLYALILVLTFVLSTLFATAGVGAANTLIPIYYSLGIPFSISAAAGLLLNVFSLSTATVNNARNKHIDWRTGTTFLIPAVIMAPIGALISIHTPRQILLLIFLAFLIYTIYNLARRKKEGKVAVLAAGTGLLVGISIGAAAGFLGGLLGVGGGMIILPVLTFIEENYKKISGTAAYIALFSSASGFISYLTILGGVSYLLWVVVMIGGIAGGFAGSYLINRFESRHIKFLIISIITVVAAKLLYTILSAYV